MFWWPVLVKNSKRSYFIRNDEYVIAFGLDCFGSKPDSVDPAPKCCGLRHRAVHIRKTLGTHTWPRSQHFGTSEPTKKDQPTPQLHLASNLESPVWLFGESELPFRSDSIIIQSDPSNRRWTPSLSTLARFALGQVRFHLGYFNLRKMQGLGQIRFRKG